MQVIDKVDHLIIGAGFFGLYGAELASKHGRTVLVVEADEQPFERASLVNQARVHLGYHYPRSLSTAKKSAGYFREFVEDFHDCINTSFTKIYAIARDLSYTDPDQFERFCKAAEIPCRPVPLKGIFDPTHVRAAFETCEHSFDAPKLRERMMARLSEREGHVDFRFNCRPLQAERVRDGYCVTLSTGERITASHVLNATYASINQLNRLFDTEPLGVKYELCEVALCDVPSVLKEVGITLMDGPFFSLMPFGFSGLHSLTSVTYTPHKATSRELPTFDCQAQNPHCSPQQLDNCNTCFVKPVTAWERMSRLARRYLDPSLDLEYRRSLFAVKAILQRAEVDDARPTVIERSGADTAFTAVLSGKINTIYDLEKGLGFST